MVYKRRYKTKSGIVGKTAKDAEQDKKIAKLTKLVNTREIKYFQSPNTSVIPNWGGNQLSLFNPVQGDDDIARIGDKVYVESIEFRLTVYKTPMSTPGNVARFILYRDKSNAMVSSALLNTAGQGTPNYINQVYDVDFRNQWELLKDFRVTIDESSATVRTYVIKMKVNKPAQFIQTSTSNASGNIYLFYASDANPPPLFFNYISTIRYSDM